MAGPKAVGKDAIVNPKTLQLLTDLLERAVAGSIGTHVLGAVPFLGSLWFVGIGGGLRDWWP